MTKPDTDRAMPDSGTPGMTKGLTHYGDPGFSLFLRKAFIKGAGFTDSALARPVIGITNTLPAEKLQDATAVVSDYDALRRLLLP